MTSARKTFEAIKTGQVNIAFADLQRLIDKLGFVLARVSGSHHIYIHPDVSRPVNIQPDGRDAKGYQIRQLRRIIDEFNLRIED